MTILLVIGGARSGKSSYAQRRAEATGRELVFVATAQAFDDEMRERILRHRDDRGPGWETVEAPLDVAETITARSRPDTVILADCLTLWASNVLLADLDEEAQIAKLLDALSAAQGTVILVANEVGLGIVPDNALARRFRDLAGTINQRIAALADEVELLVAGLPVRIK